MYRSIGEESRGVVSDDYEIDSAVRNRLQDVYSKPTS
jgi:hypothetical protein